MADILCTSKHKYINHSVESWKIKWQKDWQTKTGIKELCYLKLNIIILNYSNKTVTDHREI